MNRLQRSIIVETRTPDVQALNRLRDEIARYPNVADLTTTIILKREKEAVHPAEPAPSCIALSYGDKPCLGEFA